MPERTFLLEATDHLGCDVGNSKIRFAFFTKEGALLHAVRYDLKGAWQEELSLLLREQLSSRARISQIKALISSINPPCQQKLVELLRRFEVLSVEVNHENCPFPSKKDTSSLSGDLLADCFATRKLFPGNSIAINMGAVVAFSAISATSGFMGSVLCPSCSIAARALSQQAYLLPLVTVKKPASCAAFTVEESLCSGLYFGLLGTFKEILSRLQTELFPNERAKVVLSGDLFSEIGENATLAKAFIADLGSYIDHVEPNLTLLGLHEIYHSCKNTLFHS